MPSMGTQAASGLITSSLSVPALASVHNLFDQRCCSQLAEDLTRVERDDAAGWVAEPGGSGSLPLPPADALATEWRRDYRALYVLYVNLNFC